jgi:hypothetical protein
MKTAETVGQLLLLSWLSGCGGDAPAELSHVERLSEPLFAQSNQFWPGHPTRIPVCWENPTSANLQARFWAEHAVANQWGRYGRISFSDPAHPFQGWPQCTAGQPGIHIQDIGSTGQPQALATGYAINGLANGVQLQLSDPCPGYPTNEHCVRARALHEMGHALGFNHEEQRPEYALSSPPPPARGDCSAQADPKASDQEYGNYDINSVMSYCGQPTGDSRNTNMTSLKEGLSANDIASVQMAYYRHIGGQILTYAGLGAYCLAANAGPNGINPFLWDCDEFGGDRGNQVWVQTVDSLQLAGTGMCLDLPGGNTQNATQLQMWTCLNNGNQWFDMEMVAIRGWGGKCLDLPNGNLTPGQRVQMFDCLGDWATPYTCPSTGTCPEFANRTSRSNSNQIWTYDPIAQQIHFGALTSNWCLDFASSTLSNGVQIMINNCDSPTLTGTFVMRDDQIFVYNQGQGPKCMVVPSPGNYLSMGDGHGGIKTYGSGLPTNRAIPEMTDCSSGQLTQRWNMTGAIVYHPSGGNKRVTQSGGLAFIYDQLPQLNRVQRWDYYTTH